MITKLSEMTCLDKVMMRKNLWDLMLNVGRDVTPVQMVYLQSQIQPDVRVNGHSQNVHLFLHQVDNTWIDFREFAVGRFRLEWMVKGCYMYEQ